jgi:hypothetical protein
MCVCVYWMNLDKVETGYPWYPYLVRWIFCWKWWCCSHGDHSTVSLRVNTPRSPPALVHWPKTMQKRVKPILSIFKHEIYFTNIQLWKHKCKYHPISKYYIQVYILYHTNIYKHISISNCLYPNIILYPSKQFKHFFESVWVISIARFFFVLHPLGQLDAAVLMFFHLQGLER